MRVRTTILIILLASIAVLDVTQLPNADASEIQTISELNGYTNHLVKKLREDIRSTIFVIKSGRPVQELPELIFYKYIVKKDDTFWTIISKASLDIDTLMTVNKLVTPKDVKPGMTIFIPNMRGIIADISKTEAIAENLRENQIRPEYIHKTNKINSITEADKEFIFIPCGKITGLERSLFLGTAFMFPLEKGFSTSGFGTRRDPLNRNSFEFHSGVDIACPVKSEVYAARDGEVIYSGFQGGYGYLVVMQHEYGYQSFYGHLSRSKSVPGDKVKAGDIIAYSGNTGRTTGPHLHFEVRKGFRAVNPGILIHR